MNCAHASLRGNVKNCYKVRVTYSGHERAVVYFDKSSAAGLQRESATRKHP